ncbi:MAG: DUF58 domain-containing protein [Colwellia sp.]|jgi:uncharacterized protein (DUF58 family)|nr:MAG: DUF58 domain-containing protein [Colwellia sp.]
MWFKQKKSNNRQGYSATNCQTQLASINSNGVELAMTELLHYQNKTALIDLSARKNIHGQMSGNYLSRNKGRGMEFDEVRHYQTGDDIRAIDWRVTARTGKTHTKLFREELERPVLIATDLSASMHFGSRLLFKSVQAAHVASLVAWHAKNRGDRLGGIVFNQNEHLELKPRSRKEGVLHYLHALTSLHQSQHTSQNKTLTKQSTNNLSPNNLSYFDDNCARIRQLAKPGSLVYLITDAKPIKEMLIQHPNQQTTLNQEISALRHLTQISQHCELVICLITDPLEQELPASSVKLNVTLTDGNNRQQLTLGDKNTASTYKQQAETVFKQCSKLLTKAGARVISFSAGQTLEQQLKDGALFCNQ